jgi:small subunit ribosomal protein S6
MVHNYELMFIVRPDVDEETLNATREKVQATITANGGEIADVQDMGKRRFAYEIEKYREGFYTVYKFKAPTSVVKELDHVVRITDNIMRHLIINLDEK